VRGDRGPLRPTLRIAPPWLWGADACPVVAVLLASANEKKADETIPDPKGREFWTPLPFSLLIGLFRGPHEGAMIAILDPWQANPGWWGEGYAPVAAVLVPP